MVPFAASKRRMVTAVTMALRLACKRSGALAAKGVPSDALDNHVEGSDRRRSGALAKTSPRGRRRCRCQSRARPKPLPPSATSRTRRSRRTAAREAACARAAGAIGLPPRVDEAVAIAPSIPDIKGEGGCGGEDDLVRWTDRVVLPDKRRVSVKPAAILRSKMASALADVSAAISRRWRRASAAPSPISTIFDSFECRGRNRIVGAKLSEHGRANASTFAPSNSPTAAWFR